MVMRLATIAKKNGMDGMVCSPKEARMLREYFGDDFLIVTPGIRMDNGIAIVNDDQHRVDTPKLAMENGSSHIVVGRPITESGKPAQEVIESILANISSAKTFVPSGKEYTLEKAIYDGTIEDILRASGNIYIRKE
jgi:orotidine-5'-phosphate decarboxylase